MDQPGGLLCWHEKTAIAAADWAGSTLYQEGNSMFLHHYYERQRTRDCS
jgi:hypothetical protein